jgi:hypothetical protein
MKRLKLDLVEIYHEISHERLKKTKMRNKRHASKKDYKRRGKHIDFDEEKE